MPKPAALAPAFAAVFLLSGAATPPLGPVPPEKPARETAPVPPPKPEAPEPAPAAEPSGKDDPAAHQPPEDAAALAACLAKLAGSGAVFREAKGEDGPGSCGIDRPVMLSEPVAGVKLDPPALMRCEAALATVEWTRDAVLPAARRAFPEKSVAALATASSYVCRNRNGAETGKVSEHARGNALDIAAIAFSDGAPLPMKPRGEDGDMEGAFQRSLTATACLYFTTVLSPGSDAAHRDHLHLDVIDRKNGYRYCR